MQRALRRRVENLLDVERDQEFIVEHETAFAAKQWI
jgi:hypothetical protein